MHRVGGRIAERRRTRRIRAGRCGQGAAAAAATTATAVVRRACRGHRYCPPCLSQRSRSFLLSDVPRPAARPGADGRPLNGRDVHRHQHTASTRIRRYVCPPSPHTSVTIGIITNRWSGHGSHRPFVKNTNVNAISVFKYIYSTIRNRSRIGPTRYFPVGTGVRTGRYGRTSSIQFIFFFFLGSTSHLDS